MSDLAPTPSSAIPMSPAADNTLCTGPTSRDAPAFTIARSGAKQRILVVDDEPLLVAAVQALLADPEVEILTAGSAREGYAAALESRPQLVLLDVLLPDTDGFELCRHLKSRAETADSAVIFMTSESSLSQKIEGLNLGAVDYVTKPFVPAELKARVRAALRTKRLMDNLSRRAWIDERTGLWNSGAMGSRLAMELSRARRYGPPLACLMLDLDRFKQVNDTYGHAVGDRALKHVADLLSGSIRREDFACRYGGDEMLVLLPHTAAADAARVADRVRRRVTETPLRIGNSEIWLTCSCGVSDFATGGDELVGFADQALYKAKRSGRDRTEIATGVRSTSTTLPPPAE